MPRFPPLLQFNRTPPLVKGAWVHTGLEIAAILRGGIILELRETEHGEAAAAGGASGAGSPAQQQQEQQQGSPPPQAAPASASPGPQQQQVNREPLAWLPPTLAAVALRLLAFDAALVYRDGYQPARERLPAYQYIQVSLGRGRARGRGSASCAAQLHFHRTGPGL